MRLRNGEDEPQAQTQDVRSQPHGSQSRNPALAGAAAARAAAGTLLPANGRALRTRRPVLGGRSATGFLHQALLGLHPWVDRSLPGHPPPRPPRQVSPAPSVPVLVASVRAEPERAGKEGLRSGCVLDGVGNFL